MYKGKEGFFVLARDDSLIFGWMDGWMDGMFFGGMDSLIFLDGGMCCFFWRDGFIDFWVFVFFDLFH